MNEESDSKQTTLNVAEMIKNADLYDLINISLRSSDLKAFAIEKYF